MPSIRPAARLAFILAAWITLPGAELVIRDLTVGVDGLPTGFDWKVDSANGGGSGTGTFDTALGLHIGAAYSPVGAGRSQGPLLGCELAVSRYSQASVSMQAYGGRLSVGWSWMPSDQWRLDAGLVAGIGLASLDLAGTQAYPGFNATGSLVEYGLRVAGSYALSERWLLTGWIGWWNAQAKGKGSSQQVDFSLTAAGPAIGVGVTWRWQAEPWTIE